MDGQTPAKLSLDSLMSTVLPSLDVNTSVGNATKKFKRVRPPPGSTPPVSSGSSTCAVPAPQVPAATPHIPKNVPSDIAAAAQAVFSAPTPFIPAATAVTTVNSDNSNIPNPGGNKKRFRKSKKKNNGNNQGGPSVSTTETNTPTPNNQAGPPSNQNQVAKRKNNNNHPGKGQKRSKLDPQTIARNLDAQPELVGVSNDDDFSELLIQHVTHTNKMLQRDLQEQSRMMLAEQKRQAELLAAQVAGVAAPEESSAESSAAPQHKHGQHINNQKSTHQNRNNNSSNNGQPQQKRQQTPFVPKKDCVYFLQGTCRKAVCTFKHDIAAQQAAMAAKEVDSEVKREAGRKARGVCNFEKAGACAKGDSCPYSHDLSEEPCTFYHLRGICERGDLCRFGHTSISPERLQKLKDDLEVKLRERNEMQANANALANANSNTNTNAIVNVNPNISFGTNPHNAGPVPFQIGNISHGTQGHVQPDIQGYVPQPGP